MGYSLTSGSCLPLLTAALTHLAPQAKKIAQTPFPLPYAQLVMFFLIILMTSSPVVIVAYVDSTWGACALSFCAIFASFSLNEVSRELEGPFGDPLGVGLQGRAGSLAPQLSTSSYPRA